MDGGSDVGDGADLDCFDRNSEPAGCGLHVGRLTHGSRIAGIGQHRDPLKAGNDLAQDLDALAGNIDRLVRQPGHVAAGPGQAVDKAAAHRIGGDGEYDGNRRCRPFDGLNGAADGDDDVDLERDELGREVVEAFSFSLGPPMQDGNGAAVDPAQLLQALLERGDHRRPGGLAGRAEKADDG
jgi:hypothetical protein